MREGVRSRPTVAQEDKRIQAIRMWKTKRCIHKEIGEQVAIHYLIVVRWVRSYQANGMKAFKGLG